MLKQIYIILYILYTFNIIRCLILCTNTDNNYYHLIHKQLPHTSVDPSMFWRPWICIIAQAKFNYHCVN